jgi:uncharacterized protein with GYD domain
MKQAEALKKAISGKKLNSAQIRKLVNFTKGIGKKVRKDVKKTAKKVDSGIKKNSKYQKVNKAVDQNLKDLGIKKKSTFEKMYDTTLEGVGIKKKTKAEKVHDAVNNTLKDLGIKKKTKPKHKRDIGDKLNDLGKSVLGVTYPSLNINGVEVDRKTLKPLKKKDYPDVRAKRDRKAAIKRTLKDFGFSDKTIKNLTKEVKPKTESFTMIESVKSPSSKSSQKSSSHKKKKHSR